jgi:UDP-2,3-diacylglucosamine hydrolase
MQMPPAPSATQIQPAALGGALHELVAPTHWQCIDFISDLHLQESEPANFLAWRSYMASTPADAVIILGDLFEVWVGDDVLDPNPHSNLLARHQGLAFEDRCCRVLHNSAQSKAVYFMHGNRDFLIGNDFLNACGMQGLPDPTVLIAGTQRYLLSHGDALCLADEDYQKFRLQVRNPAWQTHFLAQPLAQRQEQARQMRAQSQARKQQGGQWIDLEDKATQEWMVAAQAHHMVHGHTHEGTDHAITTVHGQGTRYVLSDWDASATPARAQVLRVDLQSMPNPWIQRIPIELAA